MLRKLHKALVVTGVPEGIVLRSILALRFGSG
jgi:hypothetical protein